MEERAALVVVNYGSHELVRANVAASVDDAVLVVVVDSYSTAVERSRIAVVCADAGWELVTPDVNVGFGGGVNLGVAHAFAAGATVAVVLNPDARLAAGSFTALADAAAHQPMSLAAPRRIYRPDGSVWSRGLTYLALGNGNTSSAVPAGRSRTWISGACMAFARPLWEATGGIDEDYFLYWEDVDFSARVEAAGGSLLIVEEASAVHDAGATHTDHGAGEREKSGTYYYYNIRNRLVYADKHLSVAERRRWRRGSLGAARAIVLRGGRRQLLRSTGPWAAAWRGMRDGLRGVRGPTF